jgi:hypothetical protein
MQIKEVYKKIIQFANQAINDKRVKVTQSWQNSARPYKPSCNVEITNFRAVSMPIRRILDDRERITIIHYVASLVLHAYSDALHHAEIILINVYNAFSTELANNVFQGEIALHRTLQHVQAIPFEINAQNESSAVLELELSFNLERTEEMTYIDKIKLKESIK